MKRAAPLAGLILLVAAAVLLVEHAAAERKYVRLLQTGQHALDAGNGYGAIEAFSGALTLRPDSMAAYFRRGEAYRIEHRDEEAARDFRTALRLTPGAPQPLIALGDLYEASDPAQAASWYAEAVRVKSEDPMLLYKLALARYRGGSPAEAVGPLQQALARNDSLAEAHYLLGLVYRDLQRPDEAIASLQRAARLAPALIGAREELADLFDAQGRAADEISQLRALEAADAAPARTAQIALAEARQGQFDAAVATLHAAAERTPSDSQVQLALGRVHLAQAEHTGRRASAALAVEALERALGGTARRSEGLALFGRALMISGDAAGAERILREAIATSPIDPEAFSFLADASEQLSHFADARDALLSLDALQGDTASTAVRAARAQRLGRLSLRAGDPAGALKFLDQALNAGLRDVPTLALLAEARYQSADRAGALAVVDEALEIEPKNADLLRLRRRVSGPYSATQRR